MQNIFYEFPLQNGKTFLKNENKKYVDLVGNSGELRKIQANLDFKYPMSIVSSVIQHNILGSCVG